MCLLMSDRAGAAPFSQLMLLLPSISVSAADWAEVWPNFLPGAWVLSLRAACVNILWQTLALQGWLVALCRQRVLRLPLTPLISAPFSIYYTQHSQDWAPKRVLNSEWQKDFWIQLDKRQNQKPQVSLDPTFDVKSILKHGRLWDCVSARELK